MTKVVNIRKQPYEPYDVYIGRAGHGKSGYFGNGHPIGYCDKCSCVHTRESSIKQFKAFFEVMISSDPEFKAQVEGLRGK